MKTTKVNLPKDTEIENAENAISVSNAILMIIVVIALILLLTAFEKEKVKTQPDFDDRIEHYQRFNDQ